MSNWPKEDRRSFNRSEVMQEFERKIVEAAAFLSNEIAKVAQESSVDNKRKELAALRDDIAATKEALKDMNLAYDQHSGEGWSSTDAEFNGVQSGSQGLKNMAHDPSSEEKWSASDAEFNGVQLGSQADLTRDSDLEEVSEESQEAKMAMIEEMKDLVKEAVSEGNYKVAYQIERTISEILDGE